MNKKRVAIFRADLLPISETFIRDQANALTKWEPVLLGRREIKDGLPTPRLIREISPESGSRLARTLRYWMWRSDSNFVERLHELNISLVHAHFGTDATDIWPSVKAAKLPMLVTLHGYDVNIYRWWWEQGNGGLRRRAYPRRLLKMAQDPSVRFIAVSNAIRRRAIEYGVPEEKIAVRYIGVDTERFKPGGLPISQRRKRILFVGRMVEKKAPFLVIQAFAEVRHEVPDAELVMIGIGPLLDDAKLLARELKVPVEFHGAQGRNEIVEQFHRAQVFCLPSITAYSGDAEGLPISILEAQASGIPVVTSARGGCEAIRNQETGYFFMEKDLHMLTRALIDVLKGESQKFSANASEFCKREQNITLNTLKLENTYDSIWASMK